MRMMLLEWLNFIILCIDSRSLWSNKTCRTRGIRWIYIIIVSYGTNIIVRWSGDSMINTRATIICWGVMIKVRPPITIWGRCYTEVIDISVNQELNSRCLSALSRDPSKLLILKPISELFLLRVLFLIVCSILYILGWSTLLSVRMRVFSSPLFRVWTLIISCLDYVLGCSYIVWMTSGFGKLCQIELHQIFDQIIHLFFIILKSLRVDNVFLLKIR